MLRNRRAESGPEDRVGPGPSRNALWWESIYCVQLQLDLHRMTMYCMATRRQRIQKRMQLRAPEEVPIQKGARREQESMKSDALPGLVVTCVWSKIKPGISMPEPGLVVLLAYALLSVAIHACASFPVAAWLAIAIARVSRRSWKCQDKRYSQQSCKDASRFHLPSPMGQSQQPPRTTAAAEVSLAKSGRRWTRIAVCSIVGIARHRLRNCRCNGDDDQNRDQIGFHGTPPPIHPTNSE